MKRPLPLALFASALAALLAVPALATAGSITIGGGPRGGTINSFANAMAVHVPKVNRDIRASVVGSDGSVENVKRVHSGEVDFGLCYAVDSDLAWKGALPHDATPYQNGRALGYLYGAPAHLVVRADAGLHSPMDLRGKRVAVGSAGSGAASSAQRFLEHMDLWRHIKPAFLGYSQAASALQGGQIDAFWVLAGYPNRSIIEAAVHVKIALVAVGVDAEQHRFYEAFAYSPAVIPAGVYGKGLPACQTFQDATILCAHRDLAEDLVYRVMKALWSKDGMAAVTAASQAFAEMTLEKGFDGASIPLHSGAVKFWKEQGKPIPDKLIPK